MGASTQQVSEENGPLSVKTHLCYEILKAFFRLVSRVPAGKLDEVLSQR